MASSLLWLNKRAYAKIDGKYGEAVRVGTVSRPLSDPTVLYAPVMELVYMPR